MQKTQKKYSVTVVGASGLVGQTFLRILKEKRFPLKDLKLYAKQDGVGKTVRVFKRDYVIEKLTDDFSPHTDFVLFAATADISKKYAPAARDNGCVVVDNSPAFRTDENVPLVVPEINYEKCGKNKLIANPNCSTIICAKPLALLNKAFGLKRVRICTYQAVSGAGSEGIKALCGKKNNAFGYDVRKTCIPKIGEPSVLGYTTEEIKMRDELQKILENKDLRVAATCVRVPVKNCHAIALYATFDKSFLISEVYEALGSDKSIEIADDIFCDKYPVASAANGTDKVYVGRIRYDLAEKNSLAFYVLSDNLRTGAALNAYRIIRRITKNDRM